jgi:hypothetical protein
LLGGIVSLALAGNDPFGVVAFPIPEGASPAQVAAEFARWQGSIGVIIGGLAMSLIPLLASGVCGVFIHPSPPASIPVALLRMTGITLLLLAASAVGSRLIDLALSTGESSDIQTPLAMLAFEALCISLAAPLSSAVIRSRARGESRETPKDPWQAPRSGAERGAAADPGHGPRFL